MFSASPNWEKLKQIIADELYVLPDKITLNASLEELVDGDVIEIITLSMAVEEEFGIFIGDDTLSEIKIVSDLLAYVDKHAH
jgi:acyl carrier protein